MRFRLVLSALAVLGAAVLVSGPWAAGARARAKRAAGLAPPSALQAALAGPAAAQLTNLRRKPELFQLDVATLTGADNGEWPTEELADESGVELASHDASPSRSLSPRVDPERSIGVVGREAFVYSAPSFRSKKLGYLRTGAIVHRGVRPEGYRGCADGWYAVEPDGYVCVGKQATLDLEHPLLRATTRRPDRRAALPYEYGISRFPTPPFYTKIPTQKEQRAVEVELARHRGMGTAKAWSDVERQHVPELLTDHQPSYTWGGGRHSPRSVYTGRALPQSGFAMLSIFDSEDRSFALTVDLDVLPLDRLRRVEPSKFRGIALSPKTPLPVVFLRSRGAFLFGGDPRTTGLSAKRPIAYREAIPITGKAIRVGGVRYLEAREGGWVKDEHLVRINPMKRRPGWATPGRTWIDVSILKQSLVAYEGTTPVYATLVSTGADGLGDPKKTHSTVRGQFLVHTKHVTATMSGDTVGDEFDLRDVPYVQYFSEGYALHAAYWHDSFGMPRSHGCINVSPLDANWLFSWTDPPVPAQWHGAMSLREGTLVHIHP